MQIIIFLADICCFWCVGVMLLVH